MLPGSAAAQEENRAGLVIQFADGQSETWCVAFEGATISGDELLARSELEILIDPSSGMGITVCRIEGLGCAYPAEHCFCQCMGGESCAYWNYFYRDPGDEAWTYSALGALLREVPPGGMEAWVWGDGQAPPAADLTFDTVCAPPVPTAEPTVQELIATKTALPTRTATPVAAVTNAKAPAGTATQAAMAINDTPTQAPATATLPPTVVIQAETVAVSDGEETASSSYWALGLILVALGAVGLVVLLRQGGRRRA
ncbi:MAG: hypothetical protein JXA93_03330 [Anaerolineae bacterium]|nr:hypothetical protein [Anaerolineae bacterium]